VDLKQLEYFVRVAELGSFTRASIVLDVAQPALSRQIRNLEVEFGQNLLLRNGRGVNLTGAGRLMLDYSRGILHQAERLREEMSQARGALVGKIALGLPPSLVKLLVVPVLTAFKQRLPAATLVIREGLTASMQEALIAGSLDMALLYNASSSPDIDLLPLAEEELFMVARADDAAAPESLPARRLPQFPLVLPSRPNATHMLVESALAHLGLRPNISVEVDGVASILDLVQCHFGYAILSANAVAALAPHDNAFKLCRITQPTLRAQIALAVNSNRQATAMQRTLIEILQETAGKLLAG
jgi:LysR family nitrogen assimilation transcriptional regulator